MGVKWIFNFDPKLYFNSTTHGSIHHLLQTTSNIFLKFLRGKISINPIPNTCKESDINIDYLENKEFIFLENPEINPKKWWKWRMAPQFLFNFCTIFFSSFLQWKVAASVRQLRNQTNRFRRKRKLKFMQQVGKANKISSLSSSRVRTHVSEKLL